MTREHRGSVELVRSSNECIGDFESTEERSVVEISESRPGHFASIIVPPFAKLILRCWFATVVVMSERSPDQIRELLDSLYRVEYARSLCGCAEPVAAEWSTRQPATMVDFDGPIQSR